MNKHMGYMPGKRNKEVEIENENKSRIYTKKCNLNPARKIFRLSKRQNILFKIMATVSYTMEDSLPIAYNYPRIPETIS